MTASTTIPTQVVTFTDDDISPTVQGTVKVGDIVYVRAKVTSVFAEQYTVAVDTRSSGVCDVTVNDDQVVAVEVPQPPDEPDDGVWVVAEHDAQHDGLNVYVRRDAAAPREEGRRWPRRWQNIGTGEFVDWATAVAHGADPDNQLVGHMSRDQWVDLAIRDEVIAVLRQFPRGVDHTHIYLKVHQALPGTTGGQVIEALRKMQQHNVVAHLPHPKPEGTWVYRRHDVLQPGPGEEPLPIEP